MTNQKNNPQGQRGDFFSDMSNIAGSLLTSLSDMKQDMGQSFQQRLESYLSQMQWVKRDEFDAVRTILQTLVEENIALKKRLAALESASKTPVKKSPATPRAPSRARREAAAD